MSGVLSDNKTCFCMFCFVCFSLSFLSAFDPAGPFFRGQDPALRLDHLDAGFVDVIHTDAEIALKLGLGMLQPVS